MRRFIQLARLDKQDRGRRSQRYRRKPFSKPFHINVGTIFHGTQVPLQK